MNGVWCLWIWHLPSDLGVFISGAIRSPRDYMAFSDLHSNNLVINNDHTLYGLNLSIFHSFPSLT